MNKNVKKQFDSRISHLSQNILSYTKGDVLAVSDLMDDIEAINSLLLVNKTVKGITGYLLALCREELVNCRADFIELCTVGIDLINDIADIKDDSSDWKLARAISWLNKASPKPGNTDSSTDSEPSQSADADLEKAVLALTNENKVSATFQKKKEELPGEAVILDMEMIGPFASDCEERFSRAQELILLLEEDNNNMEYVKELFRIFHTIKGECGFLKLASLGFLTHNIENLLDLVRSEKIAVDHIVISYLLQGLDLSKDLLADITDGSVLINNKCSLDTYIDTVAAYTTKVKPNLGTILVEKGVISDKDNQEIIKAQIATGFDKKFGELAVEKQYISQEQLEESLQGQKSLSSNPNEVVHKDDNVDDKKNELKTKIDFHDSIIKVKTSKVNYLVDMIGELLIELGQISENNTEINQVRKIARSLQYASMQLRTESVRILFGTVRRIIRDISTKLKKPVNTKFVGEELEIDRLLIESLEEPLMHLVRNSMDHGIEDSEERLKNNKTEIGLITVCAERRGNNIVISVGDDGRGLNKEQILKKAIEKGLVNEDDALSMTDTAINNLIFMPGFSTKDKVDLLSGRGVGMDIIKQAVTRSKGHIEIINKQGVGSTFELFFPLSTAIIDGMIVRTGPNKFVIPITIIIESIKIKKENVKNIREGTTVLCLREEIIPMISLASVFGIKDAGPGLMATIVENANRNRFAIISDEIIAKKEVVIKSLGAKFRDFRGISSGTVLSGGAIGFVLDIEQFIEMGIEEKACEILPKGLDISIIEKLSNNTSKKDSNDV